MMQLSLVYGSGKNGKVRIVQSQWLPAIQQELDVCP